MSPLFRKPALRPLGWLHGTGRAALVSAALCLHGSSRAAPPSPAPMPGFVPVAWLPAMTAALSKASVPTDGISFLPADRENQIGDSVTILVQATERSEIRQWAVVLSISDIKPEERKLRTRPMSLYSNSGRAVAFPPAPLSGIAIHVFGPFSARKDAASAKDIWSGSLINPQFLRLGFDRAIELLLRLSEESARNASPEDQNFSINLRTAPFLPDIIARDRPRFDRLHITADEERAFGGIMPAMMDFFGIVSQTKGVREILFEAIDVPWWALAKNGGRMNNLGFDLQAPFERLPPADWGMPATMPVYAFGARLMLLGKPALHCRFAVTSPRVPLLNTAGILAISAARPDGKGPRIMVRVMAGRPALPPTTSHE